MPNIKAAQPIYIFYFLTFILIKLILPNFLYIILIMIVKSLYLKNFRNYDEQNINLAPGLNILLGDNAEGKTNMLESIYFCSLFSSPRTTKDKEMIMFNKDSAIVKLVVQKKHSSHSIKIKINSVGKKIVLIDDIPINRASELLGILGVVFFSPQEMKLIQESPDERRRFLNIGLSQQDKVYFKALSNYNKILTQKNALLKKGLESTNAEQMLDIWDMQLANEGEIIIKKRMDYLIKLSKYSDEQNSKLSDSKEKLFLSYETDIILEDSIKDNLYNSLKQNRERDKILGYTTIGPHRDDIKITLNGKDARKFASQGQQRSITLAMKLASLYIYYDETGEYPILLLDDVLSELDSSRQKILLEIVKNIQVVLTCTKYNIDVNANIIKIKKGVVV